MLFVDFYVAIRLFSVFSSILNIHATMQWSEVDNATSEECKLDSTWRLPFLAKPEQFREYLHRAFNNMFFIGLPKDIYIKLVPSVQCKVLLFSSILPLLVCIDYAFTCFPISCLFSCLLTCLVGVFPFLVFLFACLLVELASENG